MNPASAYCDAGSQTVICLIAVAAKPALVVLQKVLRMRVGSGFLILKEHNRPFITFCCISPHVAFGAGRSPVIGDFHGRFIGMYDASGQKILFQTITIIYAVFMCYLFEEKAIHYLFFCMCTANAAIMLLEMPNRVNHRPMPEVTLVDMRQELENGNRTVLSGALRQALTECMERGEQAMLLMNRRGYHSFVSCRACGYVVKCPQCDLSMTYHVGSSRNLLKCHYCGNETPIPEKCPSCGSRYIRYFGAGTQKVEEEVGKLLPGVPLGRMDLDTTSGKDGHGRVLEAFRSGRTRVLIGTQMIAKGLDFPQVTLVGVIAADLTLNLPDYRSRERTFQLLTQVAGRAGRGMIPGRVLIQTYKPEDPVLGFAAKQDYRAFFEDEFRRRRTALYPPFTMLARLLTESPSEENAERASAEMEREAEEILSAHPQWRKKVLLMRRDTPEISMLRGKHRRQIMMKLLVSPETDSLCASLSVLAEREWAGAEVWFEINPTTLM